MSKISILPVSILFLLISSQAFASDKINVNCVTNNSRNSLGLVSVSSPSECQFSIHASELSREETSPIKKLNLCNISPYDLKFKIQTYPAGFSSIEIKITKEKKNIFNNTKSKTIASGNLSVGEGVKQNLTLSQSINNQGIKCEFSTI
jgi:hypothetical protein